MPTQARFQQRMKQGGKDKRIRKTARNIRCVNDKVILHGVEIPLTRHISRVPFLSSHAVRRSENENE